MWLLRWTFGSIGKRPEGWGDKTNLSAVVLDGSPEYGKQAHHIGALLPMAGYCYYEHSFWIKNKWPRILFQFWAWEAGGCCLAGEGNFHSAVRASVSLVVSLKGWTNGSRDASNVNSLLETCFQKQVPQKLIRKDIGFTWNCGKSGEAWVVVFSPGIQKVGAVGSGWPQGR